jgi:hypothetical protein
MSRGPPAPLLAARLRGPIAPRRSRRYANYNDRVVALRYVYVLALSVWFGGIITIGTILAPVSGASLHRFFLTSYAAGALVLTTLFGMALLGPRPSGFFARVVVAVAMFAVTLYAGLELRTLPATLLAPIAIGGLALLFWEARDGTRAA